MQVLIAIRKDILNKVIIENRTDLVSHPYYIALDIKKLNQVSRKYSRKTQIVNLYDNKIGRECVWQEFSFTIQRAIQNILWRSIIQKRVLIIGDINAHNSM